MDSRAMFSIVSISKIVRTYNSAIETCRHLTCLTTAKSSIINSIRHGPSRSFTTIAPKMSFNYLQSTALLPPLPPHKLPVRCLDDNKERLIRRLRNIVGNKTIKTYLQAKGIVPEGRHDPFGDSFGDTLTNIAKFIDSHHEELIEELPPAAMTAVMSYFAEKGESYYSVAQRIRQKAAAEGPPHFTFELSYLNFLSNCLSSHPELDEEFCIHFHSFISNHEPALLSTEVCKELLAFLSVSSQWMQGFKILARMKESREADWSDYHRLCTAAACDGNVDVLLLLQRNFLQMLVPPRQCLEALECLQLKESTPHWNLILQRINDMDINDLQAKVSVEKVLGHWRATGYIPDLQNAHLLASWFRRYYEGDEDAVTFEVPMPKNGKCPVTAKKLERLRLVNFDILQNEFLERVLIQDNVYKNTDPDDLKNLEKFMKNHGPFDMVMDGLNACYYNNATNLPDDPGNAARIGQVLTIVKKLKKMKKKVAVISRDWWRRGPQARVTKELERHGSLFTAKSMTKDDLFLIYCAFMSGPSCYIISNDLYRDAGEMVRFKLRSSFRFWQHARQIQLTSYDNEVTLLAPRQYHTIVQEVDGSIFIPHLTHESKSKLEVEQDLINATSIGELYEIPDTFLVINPPKHKQSHKENASFFSNHPLPPRLGHGIQ